MRDYPPAKISTRATNKLTTIKGTVDIDENDGVSKMGNRK
jgi:hypothetical protein